MVRGNSTAITVRRAAAFAIAGAAATALSACGAGLVTQTDTKQPAVAGINVEAGDLALRDLQVEFDTPEGYAPGDDAPLRVWISNQGPDELRLVGVDLVDENGNVVDDRGTVTVVSAEAEEAPAQEATTPAEDETAAGDEETTEEAPGDEETSDPAGDATSEAPTAEADPFDGDTTIDIPIAPSGFVRLDQGVEGGDYLLLENLTEELLPGEAVSVVFRFSDDTTIPVELPVGPPAGLEEEDLSYFEPEEAAEGH